MYGLVFAGGGAKGAYQIGVWKALNELNIDIDIVCGTSVGALNGAYFAQNMFDEALDMWENMSMDTVFKDEFGLLDNIEQFYNKGITSTDLSILKNLYNHITTHKGLNIDPLREIIDHNLDESLIKSTGIEFGLVTIDLTNRKTEKIFASELNEGELKYYLLGSAMIPGFSQDKNHNLKFADGGIIDNMPIKMVIEKGYKDIIAVDLGNKRTPKYKGVNITHIKPSEPLGGVLYFNQQQSKKNIKLGYLDALKKFNVLKGHKYFFTNVITEQDFLNGISQLDMNQTIPLQKYLGLKKTHSKRYLLEKIVPKIQSKFTNHNKDNYQDLVITIIEEMNTELNIERLCQYDFIPHTKMLCNEVYENELLNLIKPILKAILDNVN